MTDPRPPLDVMAVLAAMQDQIDALTDTVERQARALERLETAVRSRP